MLSAVCVEDFTEFTEQTEIVHEMCSSQTRGLCFSRIYCSEARRSLRVNLNRSREAQYGPRRMCCSAGATV